MNIEKERIAIERLKSYEPVTEPYYLCYSGDTNAECSFYKIEEQYQKDLDCAILVNRARGNCKNCRYRLTLCKLMCE